MPLLTKVGRLADSAYFDNWYHVRLPDGRAGWVFFDCGLEGDNRCTELNKELPQFEPEPLATSGRPDLVLESEPSVPEAGDVCGGSSLSARSTWSVFVRNIGSAAAPRTVVVEGDG